MIKFTSHFIPAADEVFRLQLGSEPECRLFQKMAELGHYGGRKGYTRQGIYVCTPNGEFLASCNDTHAQGVLTMLKEGLSQWNKLLPPQRRLQPETDISAVHRWEDSSPEGGLILRSVTRDFALENGGRYAWTGLSNLDYVWFSKEEARRWLPSDPQTGDRYGLAPAIQNRLARFSFVDSVSGAMPMPWRGNQAAGTQINIEITQRDGPIVTLRLSGESHGHAEKSSRQFWVRANHVDAELLGFATYDLDREIFTRFELIGVGKRWEFLTLLSKPSDHERGIGFSISLDRPDAPRIAPHFLKFYNGRWVKRPAMRSATPRRQK